MPNIIKLNDQRTEVTTRTLKVGDVIISPKIADGNPCMIVIVGVNVGVFDIQNAAVLYTGSSIADIVLNYGIIDSDVTSIIPSENVDVDLTGTKSDGLNIKLPTA